jgi:hypothetical protein
MEAVSERPISGEVIPEPVQETISEIKNVFNKAQSLVDSLSEEEMDARDTAFPYVVSHDEFYAEDEDHDYPKVTLTYFEGDDVLTDERDAPINETANTVGDENLLRFGHASRDHNIVYIRNEELEIDFEVVRSRGQYVKEVLGFIEHSGRRGKTRKFRRDDG